eukprot:scaffold2384_cov143-Skeletonema_menzelii.AAC.7
MMCLMPSLGFYDAIDRVGYHQLATSDLRHGTALFQLVTALFQLVTTLFQLVTALFQLNFQFSTSQESRGIVVI